MTHDKDWDAVNDEWHSIGDGIKWRYYRHWGQNYYAGEGSQGRTDETGTVVDGSGGLKTNCQNGICSLGCCMKPIIFLAREYFKGKKRISAVLSYPKGLGIDPDYFWEIYPISDGDVERFYSQKAMHKAIKKEFNNKNWKKLQQELKKEAEAMNSFIEDVVNEKIAVKNKSVIPIEKLVKRKNGEK